MLKKKDVDYFDAKDVDKMLRFLGVSLTKSEIDLMLWVSIMYKIIIGSR